MNTAQAAALLGAPAHEVASVEDSPAGVLIRHVDGNTFVVVPEASPDAEGKTGLMLLVSPKPDFRGFPVYAQPFDVDADGQVFEGALVEHEGLVAELGTKVEELEKELAVAKAAADPAVVDKLAALEATVVELGEKLATETAKRKKAEDAIKAMKAAAKAKESDA